jgi:hypothetical protein
MPFSDQATWAWVARTDLFDQFITEQVREGVDLVVNLAAGLDARPYRLVALLPMSSGPQGSRPWSGVCLFGKQ